MSEMKDTDKMQCLDKPIMTLLKDEVKHIGPVSDHKNNAQ